MNLKRSPLTIDNKALIDIDLENEFPTLADLIKEQNVLRDHRTRRPEAARSQR